MPRSQTPLTWRSLALLVLSLIVATTNVVADERPDAARYFAHSVLPLLKQHCFECHSHEHDAAEGRLVLDSKAGWANGGDSGPAIVPGDTANSRLLIAVGYADNQLQMPPRGKLPQPQIDVLHKWIADGAFDPRTTTSPTRTDSSSEDAKRSQLWSFEPIFRRPLPAVDNRDPLRNEIDCFVVAQLQRHSLRPNPAADRYALLRRATLDLTGLPPTLDEIDQFISDDRVDAYERLIDRLLASPHYGERWGRHWLDLARYGDSNGGDINYAHAHAWRYRDYVIQSLNTGKPYDDFVCEQLAGDLLPTDKEVQRAERLTATGFLMLGPKMLAEVDTDKLLIDIVDEQLDVTGMTFLGLTLGCARCHDHKFDPITTEDYYALAGIFRSTKVIDVLRPANGVSEWLEIDVTPAARRAVIERHRREQQQLQQSLAALGGAPSTSRGTSDHATKSIVATDLPALQSTTWSAWLRIHTPQNLGGVISASYPGANQGHSLGFDRGNTPRVVWNHGSQPHTIIAATQTISYGQWHHLALTFDAAAEQLQLYVDGNMAATAANVATSEFQIIGVGRREASHQFSFVGDVDEVHVFDTALDKTRIQDLFARRPIAATPLLHWSFDRLADNHVIDTSGNGRHGRLVGLSVASNLVDDGVAGYGFTFSHAAENEAADPERQRRIAELRQRIEQVESAMPRAIEVMAVAELPPIELPVHIRGSHLNLASRPTARGTPRALETALDGIHVPPQDSGRLQLARWIAHPANPLTARVMVNRIWQHHFGTGLVRSPSNFGVRGDRPSHPELLDWLADEFVSSGWDLKQMHRLMMHSAAYRASSRTSDAAAERDPDNQWLSRYAVRRLEAEAIRDSLLAVSGRLDTAMGGSLFPAQNKKRVTLEPNDSVYVHQRRSVYLPAVRVRSFEMFSIFDLADNGQHIASRPRTMVAQQALFLMNNPQVIQVAADIARRIAARTDRLQQRIDLLHRLLYARPATLGETATLGEAFAEFTASDAARGSGDANQFAWQQIVHTMICSNEFLYLR